MKTIRWGILGTDDIAYLFAKDLRLLPDNELWAVGSHSQAEAQQFAKKLSVPRAYGSYDELVSDPKIDIVFIVTPVVFHKEHSLLCLEAGKSILVEKPFAMTAVEAGEIAAYARERNLFCMEAMWMRFIPGMQAAIRLLKDGVIGDVYMFSASLGFYNEFDPNYRLFNPALGGGAMMDLGVYPLSLIFQVLGRPSTISSQLLIGASGVDEHTAVLLSFPGGPMATLSTGFRGNGRNDAFVMGTQGNLHIHAPLLRPKTLTIYRNQTAVSELFPNNPLIARLKNNALTRRLIQQAQQGVKRIRSRQTIKISYQGSGYSYEAEEASRCLRQNLCESHTMPLDETIAIMEVIDTIRCL